MGAVPAVVPPDLLCLEQESRYKQVSVIGAGAHGLVLRALDTRKGDPVALKCLQRGSKITKYVLREISNQLRLKHPHIIAIREVFLSDDHLVLVLDLAAGGDLLKHVAKAGRLSEDEARWFFQQIMFAMHYSHRMGVSNRDVKLENVLLATTDARPIVRLSDYGFSKDENYHSAPGSRVGTPAYLAPEVISNVTGGSYDAKKADVWSCGVLLFVMVAGRYPFTRAEDERQPGTLGLQASFQRILNVDFTFPRSHPLSEGCKDLISKMLTKDPAKRLSVEEVLKHPWCNTEMNSQLLAFNEALVAQSMATVLQPEVVREIESIVDEARRPGPRAQELQMQYQAMAGAAQHSMSLFDEELLGGDGDGDSPEDLDY